MQSPKFYCSEHTQCLIQRVTFDSNKKLKKNLLCEKCQQLTPYLQTNVKFNSFKLTIEKFKNILNQNCFKNTHTQISKIFEDISNQLKCLLTKFLQKTLFVQIIDNHSLGDYEKISSNIIWKYIYKINNKNLDLKENQIFQKITKTQHQIHNFTIKLLLNLKNQIAKKIQDFKINIQDLKNKNFQSTQFFNVEKLQRSMKRSHQREQQKQEMPKKIVKKNTQEDCKDKQNIEQKQKQIQNNNKLKKNQKQLSKKKQLKDNIIILQKQIMIPLQSYFIQNQVIPKHNLIKPNICLFNNLDKNQILSLEDTNFIIGSPKFSQKFQSQIIKIQKIDKNSELFIGACIQKIVHQKNYKNCFGFSQGTFCIKGSPSVSNITFYSHQYKTSIDLKNYSIQEGYFLQIKINKQKFAIDFFVIKPMFRHLGTMMFKNINPDDLSPIIGMKGNGQIKLIQKEVVIQKKE